MLAGVYLSKVDLIENDFVRMTYAPESCYERKERNDAEGELVVPL